MDDESMREASSRASTERGSLTGSQSCRAGVVGIYHTCPLKGSPEGARLKAAGVNTGRGQPLGTTRDWPEQDGQSLPEHLLTIHAILLRSMAASFIVRNDYR